MPAVHRDLVGVVKSVAECAQVVVSNQSAHLCGAGHIACCIAAADRATAVVTAN